MNIKNHFVIVGAQRSGTTYLYELLKEHPEICMSAPMRPEPKYFLKRSLQQVDIENYFSSFFRHCGPEHKVTGEKSTSYYECEESARLLSATFPDAMIIFLLRDPVKRALSNYFFSYNHGLESRSLDDVFVRRKPVSDKIPQNISVDPFNYLGRGVYVEFIKMYQKYFPAKQIKVIVFEEFVNNLQQIQKLYRDLGVESSFVPEKRSLVINASQKEMAQNTEVVRILSDYYKPFNKKLENLLNRDVCWWEC